MFINDYQYEQGSTSFSCEEGEQFLRVEGAEITRSKTGKQMLVVAFSVSNSNGVFYKENFVEGDFFNKSMSRFFDAFQIKPGNFNLQQWKGKQGRAMFQKRQEEYQDTNGNWKQAIKTKLAYFIVPSTQQQQQQQQQRPEVVYTDDPNVDQLVF